SFFLYLFHFFIFSLSFPITIPTNINFNSLNILNITSFEEPFFLPRGFRTLPSLFKTTTGVTNIIIIIQYKMEQIVQALRFQTRMRKLCVDLFKY
ncbi:hypothetical protein BpHYR1_013203, partial [Brachionus plicatilis]